MRILFVILALIFVASCSTQTKKASRGIATQSALHFLHIDSLLNHNEFLESKEMTQDDWSELVHQEKYGVVKPPMALSLTNYKNLSIASNSSYIDFISAWKKQVHFMKQSLKKHKYLKYPKAYLVAHCQLSRIPSSECANMESLSAENALTFERVLREKAAQHIEVIFSVLLKNDFKCSPTINSQRNFAFSKATTARVYCGKEWAALKLRWLKENKPHQLLELLSLTDKSLKSSRIINTNSEAYKWLSFMVSAYPGSVAGEITALDGYENQYARQLARAYFWQPEKPKDYTEEAWQSHMEEIRSEISSGEMGSPDRLFLR